MSPALVCQELVVRNSDEALLTEAMESVWRLWSQSHVRQDSVKVMVKTFCEELGNRLVDLCEEDEQELKDVRAATDPCMRTSGMLNSVMILVFAEAKYSRPFVIVICIMLRALCRRRKARRRSEARKAR